MLQIALIPAYMPDEKMLDTICSLKKYGFEVVVVDDGSGVEFSHLFQTASDSATVLKSEKNCGKGSAIKKGFLYIQENYEKPYTVVTVDADGQHKISDAVQVCEESCKHPNSLILGSRKLNPHVPLRSKLGNTITRFVFRLSTGKSIYDTQTGLRAFSDALIPEMLNISGFRYEYEMNVLMQLAKKSVEIIEVPIETVYFEDNESSHFDTMKDSYRIYKEIIKFSASSFVSFGIDYLLFCLLAGLTENIVLANIAARVCSSTVNFTLNRKIVFKSKGSLKKSAAKYFTLVACILLCNTLIVRALCAAGVFAFLAKIITEILLFGLNWFIQHKFIFRKK